MPEDDALRDGLLAIEDSQQAVMGTDSSLRAYLTTRDPYFRDRAAEFAPAIAAAESTMVAKLGRPEVFPRVLELVAAQRRWQADWVGALSAEGTGDVAGFVARGDVLMAGYREASAAARSSLLATIDATTRSVR